MGCHIDECGLTCLVDASVVQVHGTARTSGVLHTETDIGTPLKRAVDVQTGYILLVIFLLKIIENSFPLGQARNMATSVRLFYILIWLAILFCVGAVSGVYGGQQQQTTPYKQLNFIRAYGTKLL